MTSRGLFAFMGARTRRSLTLLWVALFLCSLMMQYTSFAAPSSVLAASGLLASTVQGFEIDGDLLSGNGASNPGEIPAALIDNLTNGDDWLDGASGSGVVDPDDPPNSVLIRDAVDTPNNIAGDDTPDDSAFVGGNKEEDTRDWGYVNTAGPNGKTDYRHVGAAVKRVGDSAVVYLFGERVENNGTMVLDMEMNAKPWKVYPGAPGIEKPDRSAGDLLISMLYSNGGDNPQVAIFEVASVQNFSTGQVVTFTQLSAADTLAAVRSATNFVDLYAGAADSGFGYDIDEFNFAEASINLASLGIELGCPGFSQAHIRSRTGAGGSNELDLGGNSQLKDTSEPFGIDLNNCGEIIVEKETDPDGSSAEFDFEASWDSGPNPDFTLGDGDSTSSGPLAPGEYSVAETVPSGWDLESATCDDGSPVTAIDLDNNETVTCTFNNRQRGRIIVEKQTSPDGATGSFTFTGDAAGTIGDNGQIVVPNLVPGTYTSTENDPAPPFDLGDITCDDANSTDDVATRTATFRVEAGETVKCTFTNVKRGSITIIKNAIPDDAQDFAYTTTGSGLSGFTLDDDASLGTPSATSNTQTFLNVVPGGYSVTESAVAGWELTDLSCEASGSGSSGAQDATNAAKANITLGAGGSVTCTYENTKQGRIIVDKVTDPAGDPQSFTFTTTGTGYAGFSLTDAAAPNDSGFLSPGSYSVAETVPGGWELKGASCDGGELPGLITLSPGQIVNCTFNNEKDSRIIVRKETNPDGDPQVFNFTADYDPDGFSLSDGQSNDSGPLDPGEYNVAETVPSGWDLESATCDLGETPDDIDLGAGETVTCTFNNEKDAFIVVEKVTEPAGDPADFTFSASYDADGFVLSDGEQDNSGDLDPGQYTVSETVPSGWDLDSAVCDQGETIDDIDLGAGETVKCTFTNIKRGTIIVEKQTSPDGATGTFTFTGDAAGPIGDGGQIVVSNLVPGTYSSTEADPSPAFDLGDITCTDGDPNGTASSGDEATRVATFELDPGETVKCVFTNVQRGSITIIKNAIPDDSQDFSFNATGSGLSSFVLDDDGDPGNGTSNLKTFTNLVAGPYSVTEVDPGLAWDLTDLDCVGTGGSTGTPSGATANITLTNGGSVTCTYENTKRGSITIIKDAQPNDAQDFHFDVTGGEGPVAFNLDDDADGTLSNNITMSNLLPGAYSAVEAAVAGWDLTGLTCNDGDGGTTVSMASGTASIDLDPGQSITCTFVNSKPSIQVVKTAGDAADGATFVTLAGPVTYTYVVTNTGPVTLVGIVVRDDAGTPANTADDFTATCPKTTLAAGESMTCSATVTVTSDRTNIGKATGESEKGTDVEDTDNAVVVIRSPQMDIVKSHNDADGVVGRGQVVTYTLKVKIVNGPVTNAVITDLLPAGQTYVAGSQTSSPSATTFGVSGDGKTLTWTYASLANGDPAATLTYQVTIDANAPTGNQTNTARICVAEIEVCDETTTTVRVPTLTILKAVAGNTAGSIGGVPQAKQGDTLTFTLTYDLTNGPVTGGVITDVLPLGYTYVPGSATASTPGGEFTFASFTAATRTLRWTAPTVSQDGSVSYRVTVDVGAAELPQPLVNVATIDSNETTPDDDDQPVLVQEPPAPATATPRITPPPTDLEEQAPGNPGFSLMLVLLGLAGFVLAIGYLTPVPERARRRDRR